MPRKSNNDSHDSKTHSLDKQPTNNCQTACLSFVDDSQNGTTAPAQHTGVYSNEENQNQNPSATIQHCPQGSHHARRSKSAHQTTRGTKRKVLIGGCPVGSQDVQPGPSCRSSPSFVDDHQNGATGSTQYIDVYSNEENPK